MNPVVFIGIPSATSDLRLAVPEFVSVVVLPVGKSVVRLTSDY